ncbi:MAG: type II toxin-antitoxin system HicB family antitoxin [Candidatus Vogelbacteria bacterium]|nr:type II toxin-antitoxin system HicB family antitoxin [Candidatus Vogelbacteria bacterium]
MKRFNLKSIIWKEGKYYVAQCLNVDVSSFGKTKQEARVNLEEALALYLDNKKSSIATVVGKPEIVTSTLRYA